MSSETPRTNVLQSSSCIPSPYGDRSTITALLVAVMTLLVCVYFFARVWKAWAAQHAVMSPSTTVNGTLASENTSSVQDLPYSKHLPMLRRPSLHLWRHMQQTLKCIKQRCNNQLMTLLLGSWLVLTLDQLVCILLLASYQWICPDYNCANGPELITPGCPGGFFLGVMLHLQPLGSCLFVVATINRFVNVYKVLSQVRARLLKAGTIAVVVMLLFRWISLMAFYWVGVFVQDPRQAAEWVDLIWMLHDSSLLLSYSVFALADLASLALGLHYIRQTQEEVKQAKTVSLQVESIGIISTSMSKEDRNGNGIGAPHSHHQDSTLPASLSGTSGCGHGNSQLGSSASQSPLHQKDKVKRKPAKTSSSSTLRKQYAMQVTTWTLTAMALLAVYLLVQLVPGVLRSLHAQTMLAVMTLVLKVFAGSITMAISSMTRLVVHDTQ